MKYLLISKAKTILTLVSLSFQDKGPGWKTVSEAQFTKFTEKKSPPKKFIEIGTSVICIHSKVTDYTFSDLNQ